MADDNYVLKTDCTRLHENFNQSMIEIKSSLAAMQTAIQIRNNKDAYSEGMTTGVEKAHESQISNMRLWGKIIIAVLILLSGLGVFSGIRAQQATSKSDIDYEKIIEALREIIKAKE
jgi:hypothetical protein